MQRIVMFERAEPGQMTRVQRRFMTTTSLAGKAAPISTYAEMPKRRLLV
jgi:hypothetical protein